MTKEESVRAFYDALPYRGKQPAATLKEAVEFGYTAAENRECECGRCHHLFSSNPQDKHCSYCGGKIKEGKNSERQTSFKNMV